MDPTNKYGTIENHSKQIHVGQIHVRWEIKNFFSLLTKSTETDIKSPVFQIAKADWYISVRLNGLTTDESVGSIGIFLYRSLDKNILSDPFSGCIPINFTAGIGCDEKYSLRSGCHLYDTNGSLGCGYPIFIVRKELNRRRQELVPGDTLTVVCKARIEFREKYIDGISSLSEDIENLFQNEKDCDATIKVKDKVFHVHKLILSSRSPVLSAMFTHDMKEKISGRVNIDDCEPDIFHDFLLYLYSGKTENLSPSNAVCLHYLADKYNLKDLQQICVDFLKYNLDLDNIFKVVILANRHNEEELRDTAIRWFLNNYKDVFKSDQWVTFLTENPILAAELLKKALG